MRGVPTTSFAVFIAVVLCLVVGVLSPLAAAGELRLAYEDFPPFEYQQDGEPRGTHVSLIRQVCDRLGLTPVFLNRPFARAMADARSGQVDGIFSLFRNTIREGEFHYADTPLSFEDTVVFVTRGDLHPASVRDLAGLRVGVIRGYYYGEGVSTQLPPEVDQFKDMESLLRMLGEGRIDAALATRHSGEYIIRQLGYQDRARVVLQLSRRPLFIAFTKARGAQGRHLAEQFSRELEAMGAGNGTASDNR
jgi:polar amino acid transport system substrate-binding protein